MLLLLPLLSWGVSTGGFPFCCWGLWRCPMGQMAGQTGGRMGQMNMAGGAPNCYPRPQCAMSAATPLILPAPAVPVMPGRAIARLRRPAPRPWQAADLHPAPLPAHNLPVFHPPLG